MTPSIPGLVYSTRAIHRRRLSPPYACARAREVTAVTYCRLAMLQITPTLALDERDIEERFVRASGPGGQNVNKVATAVELRFDVDAVVAPARRARQRLVALAGRRMTAGRRAADRQPRAPHAGAEPRSCSRTAGFAHPSGDDRSRAATGDEDHEGGEAAPACDQEEARQGEGRAWPPVRRRLIAGLGSWVLGLEVLRS